MLTELDIKCLSAIADDYEEIPQIQAMLRHEFEIEYNSEGISLSLIKLIGQNMAMAYGYDPSKQSFEEFDFTMEAAQGPCAVSTWEPGEPTSARLWFYITPKGSECLKNLP